MAIKFTLCKIICQISKNIKKQKNTFSKLSTCTAQTTHIPGWEISCPYGPWASWYTQHSTFHTCKSWRCFNMLYVWCQGIPQKGVQEVPHLCDFD